MPESKQPFFDKNTTNIIKGIALIFMFVLHFVANPMFLPKNVTYPLLLKHQDFWITVFNMCVPVFAFLTGYFYYFCKTKTYKYSFKKISDILVTYWIVFIPFALIALIFVNYKYDLPSVISEMFGIETPTMIFCWYVFFYAVTMLVLPLITKIISKNIYIDLLIIFIVYPFIFEILFKLYPNIPYEWEKLFVNLKAYFPSVLVGYIFANYSYFEKVDNFLAKFIKFKSLKICAWFAVAILSPMFLYFCSGFSVTVNSISALENILPDFAISLSPVYIALFIYSIANLCKYFHCKLIDKVLARGGKYSLLMWFTSCIFFGNSSSIFKPILYLPKNPVLVVLWGLLLCFIISYPLNILVKKINFIKNKSIFKEKQKIKNN